MPRPLGGGGESSNDALRRLTSDVYLTSHDVCRVHREYTWRPQLLEARPAGRRRPGVRRVWAGAGPQRTGRGHIVAAARLQLVMPRP